MTTPGRPAGQPASQPAVQTAGQTAGLAAALTTGPASLRRGPLALILIEDQALVAETLRHHLSLGFAHVLALSPEPLALPPDLADEAAGRLTNAIWDTRAPAAHAGAVNLACDLLPPGTWIFYAFNAEFLFYPFCETRGIAEMLDFHQGERRAAMAATVIDLYPGGPADAAAPLAPAEALLDPTGYHALARPRADGGGVHERQFDLYGGLRWRMEPLLPDASLRLDRIPLLRTRRGLRLAPDHRLSDQEYNTLSCPWHHSLTAALASFRLAKGLLGNPGSRGQITRFDWPGSERFEWSSQQLLRLGLIEPGQWF